MATSRYGREIEKIVRIPLVFVIIAWVFSLITRHYLITLTIVAYLYFRFAPAPNALLVITLISLYFLIELVYFLMNNHKYQAPHFTRIPRVRIYDKYTVVPAITVPTLLAGMYYVWKLRHRWGDGSNVSYLTVPKRYKITRYPKLRQIRIDPNAPTLMITALIKMNRSGHTAHEFTSRQEALAAILHADWVHIREISPSLASLDVDWRSFSPHAVRGTPTKVPSRFSKAAKPALTPATQLRKDKDKETPGTINIDKGTGTLF